jgi:inhibitor of KinA
MLYEKFQYLIMGDRSVLVELGNEISPEVNRRVRQLDITLMHHPIEGIVDVVPAYKSLLIMYDPLRLNIVTLQHWIEDLREKSRGVQIPKPKTMEIPVVYGSEYGPDLEWVANYHHLAPDEVIRLHTGTIYQVYMIGFTPGHPYIAKLPKALITPRRETPRTRVPRGSVAIGMNQTVIYPTESAGGMQIIGRTPLELFNPDNSPPTLLRIGDLVRFVQIKKEEMAQWEHEKPWRS